MPDFSSFCSCSNKCKWPSLNAAWVCSQCVVIVFCYIATCTILIYESTAVLAKNQKGPHCIHNHSVSFRRRANIGLPGGKKVLPAMCVQKYRTNGNGVMQFCWVLCYGRSAFPFTTFADRRLRGHIKNGWNYICSFDAKTLRSIATICTLFTALLECMK